MSNAMAVIEGEVVPPSALAVASKQQNAADLYRHATDVAGVCGEIVKRTAQAIQGRKYVRVEGWQAIATTYGCVASARDVERVATGFRAIGEIRRMSDGAVIATAEGFVGDDETTWAGRPEYARRAMCQTRAISRACRSAFAFVVVLIDSSLSTTPAEEVPEGGFNDSSKPIPAPAGVDKLRQQVARPPAPSPRGLIIQDQSAPPPHTDADAPGDAQDFSPGATRTHDGAMSFAFGNSKGVAISAMDDKSLSFYEGAFQRDLADASKSKWHAKTSLQLAAVQAEKRFRGVK